MSLAPLAEATPETGTEAPQSFRDRKLSQLQAEPEPTPGRPSAEAESVEDGYPEEELDLSQEIQDDEDNAGEIEASEDEELVESTESEDDDESEELSYEALHDKYKSLEKQFSKVTENRKKLEQDLSDGVAENIVFRHQLEDTVQQAKAQGAIWLTLANQQVQKFEQLDWTKIPPDQIAQVKQQATKAMQNRDAIINQFKAVEEQSKQLRETVKKRESEVSRNILTRRIPEWSNEHYLNTLAGHAVNKLHYTQDEYNDITDWRLIELIHKDWEREQAAEKVQRVKHKQKANVPRNRNARKQPRNAEGRFQNARSEAFANPGDKKSFREMQMQKLQRERAQGR